MAVEEVKEEADFSRANPQGIAHGYGTVLRPLANTCENRIIITIHFWLGYAALD